MVCYSSAVFLALIPLVGSADFSSSFQLLVQCGARQGWLISCRLLFVGLLAYLSQYVCDRLPLGTSTSVSIPLVGSADFSSSFQLLVQCGARHQAGLANQL